MINDKIFILGWSILLKQFHYSDVNLCKQIPKEEFLRCKNKIIFLSYKLGLVS